MTEPRKALKRMNIQVGIMIAALLLIDVAIWIVLGRCDEDRFFATTMACIGIMFVTMFTAPMIWMYDCERRKTIRIAIIVHEHQSITINAIATMLNISPSSVKDKLTWCFEHDLLNGYLVKEDVAFASKNVDPDNEEHTVECPNCDATFTYVGNKGICPYCGHGYPPNKQ